MVNEMTGDLVVPAVDDAVWALRPDFVALSVVVDARGAAPAGITQHAAGQGPAPAWQEAHFDAWRDAYRAFGAKPQRTPCSAEALAKRVARDGGLPTIAPLVDLYNAISVAWAVPVGGEDLAAYDGRPRLVRANGGEPFDTVASGQPIVESVDAGEVVWRDDRGVTCRRWNWRQCTRTRVTADSRLVWFVLERLDPMPLSALREAGDALEAGIVRLFPGAIVSRHELAR